MQCMFTSFLRLHRAIHVSLHFFLFSLDLAILPGLYSNLTHIKNVYLFSRKSKRKGFTPFPVRSGTLPLLTLCSNPTQHFLLRSSLASVLLSLQKTETWQVLTKQKVMPQSLKWSASGSIPGRGMEFYSLLSFLT
jgi:hypothetical protein